MSAHELESGSATRAKLNWLIAGRLATALFLIILGLIWSRSGTSLTGFGKPLALLAVVSALTILYAIVLRLSNRLLLQARVQFGVDILLITWLVWASAHRTNCAH